MQGDESIASIRIVGNVGIDDSDSMSDAGNSYLYSVSGFGGEFLLTWCPGRSTRTVAMSTLYDE
jgi:hypothetical protein